jgi:hypothetical protein
MDQKIFKHELKKRITLGLNYGLQSVEEVLTGDSLLMNEFISFKSQYNDLNRLASQNTLAYSEVERGFNKIRMGLIDIIDRMSEKDIIQKETLPELKNTELQFRKNNFFQLLDIHYSNLGNVTLTMQYSYNDQQEKDQYKGIDAIQKIYIEFFAYGFKDQRNFGSEGAKDIQAYSLDFFDNQFPRLDPYLKTVKFILKYIMEEKMEQSFFLGIFRSVISTYELLLIFYFAISGLDPELGKMLVEGKFFDERFKSKLVKKEHFELLNS